MNGVIDGKLLTGGRSISIGGPSNFLPDTPQKIVSSGTYNKSIRIIIGTTRDDGDYAATGEFDLKNFFMRNFLKVFVSRLFATMITSLINNHIDFSSGLRSSRRQK